LAAAFGDKIISYPFSIAAFLRTVRTCKLYDYRRGCWTDFDGNPTTTPKVQPHPEVNDSQAASPSVANRREP
jgi:omega-6 fatty acid desaturase (delta-12 desaturase)